MKRILSALFIIIFLVGCTTSLNQANTNAKNGKTETMQDMKAEVLPDLLDGVREITMDEISKESLMENISKVEISSDFIFGFDSEEMILYQDISRPEEEIFEKIRIIDLQNDKTTDIDLEKKYNYIDTIRVLDGNLYFVASNTGNTFDYVEINPAGEQTIEEISDFMSIAASSGPDGFYINTEKNSPSGVATSTVTFKEFGPREPKKILEEKYIIKDQKVVNGILPSNYFVLDQMGGFQDLPAVDESLLNANASYLHDPETGELYEIPFIHRFSSYLSGNREFILNLKGWKPNGEGEKDRCTLYKKEGEGYRAYILPGYDYSNFIAEARVIGDNTLFIKNENFLDFIDLTTMEGKRFPYEKEETVTANLSSDSELYFILMNGDRKTIYWGEYPR